MFFQIGIEIITVNISLRTDQLWDISRTDHDFNMQPDSC